MLEIGLDDRPAGRIACICVRCSFARLLSSGLSLLMDFCGWSRLAEGEDKDQVFLISLAIGEMKHLVPPWRIV